MGPSRAQEWDRSQSPVLATLCNSRTQSLCKPEAEQIKPQPPPSPPCSTTWSLSLCWDPPSNALPPLGCACRNPASPSSAWLLLLYQRLEAPFSNQHLFIQKQS